MTSTAPYQLYSDTPVYFWWRAGTLFHAQRGGIDPSEVYTSTDLQDALDQSGFDPDSHVVRANEQPEDFEQF